MVAEVFAHRTSGERSDVLHWGRIGSCCSDDNRIIHCAEISQGLDNLSDRRTLLTNGNVDTDYVPALLVDDGVERDGRFAGLAVTNDELALPSADRDHRVDSFDAGLQWLLH